MLYALSPPASLTVEAKRNAPLQPHIRWALAAKITRAVNLLLTIFG